jgi:hypothetical protein
MVNNKIIHSTVGNALIHGLEVNGKNIVQMRASDGFFNLTYMCNAAGTRAQKYLKSERSKGLIDALKEEALVGATLLIDVIHRGVGAGSWAHPDVAVDCAMWCSPNFGIAVSRLVQKFMSGKLTTEESEATSSQLASAAIASEWDEAREISLDTIKERQTHMRDSIPNLNPRDYAQFNNRSNQVIFGFEGTTRLYKKQHKIKNSDSLAKHMSTSQLHARSLLDAMSTERLRVKQIKTKDGLKRIREQTANDLEQICKKVRDIGN